MVSPKQAYGDEDFPVSGIGQGNGLGPTLWVLISTVLIRMMERKGHGVDLLNSISLRAICLVCFAFIDDTDLVINGRNRFSKGEDIREEFQVALDQ